jgi:hypothetical protein
VETRADSYARFHLAERRASTHLLGALAFFAVYMAIFLYILPVEAARSSSAFLSTPSRHRRRVTTVVSRVTTTLSTAAPGTSDDQRKQERDAEIRAKISKLKREGKMKNADGTKQSAEDSAMLEAEAYFNKASPVKMVEWQSGRAETSISTRSRGRGRRAAG